MLDCRVCFGEQWLVRCLRPVCDASQTFSDYILAEKLERGRTGCAASLAVFTAAR